MKDTEQYFLVVLFMTMYNVVLTSESVDKIRKCDHWNDSYGEVLSCFLQDGFCSFRQFNVKFWHSWVTVKALISSRQSSFPVVRFSVDLRYQTIHVSFSSSVAVDHFELVRVLYNTLNYSVTNVAYFDLKLKKQTISVKNIAPFPYPLIFSR